MVLQRVTSHASGKHASACVTSVITVILWALNDKRDDRFPEDATQRKHAKLKTESSFFVHGRLYGAGEVLLFRFSLRPVNQNTNNIIRRMRHRNGEKRVVVSSGYLGRKEERVLQ